MIFFLTNMEGLRNKDILHLPDNWTKLEVFEAFKMESSLHEETSLTYSWFCRIWNSEFPRVRIPKRSRFSTCAPCTEFKALRDKATLEAERSMLYISNSYMYEDTYKVSHITKRNMRSETGLAPHIAHANEKHSAMKIMIT